MSKQDETRSLLAANLRRVMLPKESEAAFGRRVGISQRTSNRVLNAKNGTTLDTLTTIASKLHCEPWQLLVANLDLRNKPVIAALTDEEKNLYRKLLDAKPTLKGMA